MSKKDNSLNELELEGGSREFNIDKKNHTLKLI